MKALNTDLPLFELYLNDKTTLMESSIYVYIVALKRFLAENPEIDKIEDYNDFLIRTTQRKRNANFYYFALKHYIKYKIPDLTLRNRMNSALLKPTICDPKVKRKYLPDEKRLEVINNMIDNKSKVIALIQCLTGVRAGDIMKLKRDSLFTEDVKGKAALRLNIIGKRDKLNVVYIFDDVAQQIILDYANNNINFENYLFLTLGQYGNRCGDTSSKRKVVEQNYKRYWRDLKQALHASNVHKDDFATHDFRRCFAREIWDRYKDLIILQNALNHTNVSTTVTYLKHSGLQNRDVFYEHQMNEKP